MSSSVPGYCAGFDPAGSCWLISILCCYAVLCYLLLEAFFSLRTREEFNNLRAALPRSSQSKVVLFIIYIQFSGGAAAMMMLYFRLQDREGKKKARARFSKKKSMTVRLANYCEPRVHLPSMFFFSTLPHFKGYSSDCILLPAAPLPTCPLLAPPFCQQCHATSSALHQATTSTSSFSRSTTISHGKSFLSITQYEYYKDPL